MKNTKAKAQQANAKSGADTLLWVVVLALAAAAVVADYYFKTTVVWSLRLVGWIVVAGIAVFLIALTHQGKRMWHFSRESRIEIRKVVWPKRQETMRTTSIVAALVLLTALIMWAADAILFWLIGFLTG